MQPWSFQSSKRRETECGLPDAVGAPPVTRLCSDGAAGVSQSGDGVLGICKALEIRNHVRFGEVNFSEHACYVLGGR